MRFERGKDPRHTMEIGLNSREYLIHVSAVSIVFRIGRFEKKHGKPVHSTDWKRFFQMWESGKWDNKWLTKMLGMKGFGWAFTKIHIDQISIKKRFIEEPMSIPEMMGNYVLAKVGKGEEIYVSLAGRIYRLEGKEFEHGFWL